ncbi:hypothetical protein PIB30_047517 [Stylosanthes scabra]|uniref:Uncharacterized protein n=1 Tax=Stylosanthes scabra TaxID=79078 RepID=A0ABU6XH14_9FABA|nr:hypothetical protein [Stylosanthes scabra]
MGSNPTYCIVPFHRPIPETQQRETPPRFLLRRALEQAADHHYSRFPASAVGSLVFVDRLDSKAEEATTSREDGGVQGSEPDGEGGCVVVEGVTVLQAHSRHCYDVVLNLRF